MKWTPEKRLSTLEQVSIENTLSVHMFGNNPTDANFKKLAETLSDMETMIEVHELSFGGLRYQMDKLKKEKLQVLKKQTALKKVVKEHEIKAEEIKKEVAEVPKKINQKGKVAIFKGKVIDLIKFSKD